MKTDRNHDPLFLVCGAILFAWYLGSHLNSERGPYCCKFESGIFCRPTRFRTTTVGFLTASSQQLRMLLLTLGVNDECLDCLVLIASARRQR